MSYTLVQHSGFGYGNDVRFRRAVELRSCGIHDARRVHKVGGLLLATYRQASDLEYKLNYPPGFDGMIPRCSGSFAKAKVDGLRIYVPTPTEVDEALAAESERLLVLMAKAEEEEDHGSEQG